MLNPSGLSDVLLFSTVKISVDKGNNRTSFGTGFYFEISTNPRSHLLVLITNKHLIEGGLQGEFYAYRANPDGTPNGEFETFIIENDFETAWIKHPNEAIDLCAHIVNPSNAVEPSPNFTVWRISSLKESMILNNEELRQLRTVEEVLMVGYPDGRNDLDSHYPLIRKGITSLHPAINYNRNPMGVLDISSFPGSSGSPIFIFNEEGDQRKDEALEQSTKTILLGVLSDAFTSEPESDSIFDRGYYLNLGRYIKAEELIQLGTEVKKNHILQVNPTITETINLELETAQNLSTQSFNLGIMHIYSDVIQEVRNYIVWSDDEAPRDFLPPLHTVIKEINYLVNENKLNNIVIDDFTQLLEIRNLAVDSSEQTNNNKSWQKALETAKRIIISFRLLRDN